MPYAAGQHPPHLPRHLLFRILAYRLQANQLGDLERREVTVIFCDLVDSTGSWGQPPSSLAGVRFDGMSITFGCSLWVIPSDRAASSYHLLDLNFAFLTSLSSFGLLIARFSSQSSRFRIHRRLQIRLIRTAV